MKFKSYIINSVLSSLLMAQTNASKIEITTLLEGDMNQPANYKLIQSIIPMNLTISVMDPTNPSNEPIWSWNDPNFGMNGNQMAVNNPTTTTDDSTLDTLAIGQLTYSLTFPSTCGIPVMNGVYQNGTSNPLTSINFTLNTLDPKILFANYPISGTITGNQNDLFQFTFPVLYAPASTYNFQTFAMAPQGAEAEKKLIVENESPYFTIYAPMSPESAQSALAANVADVTNIPLRITVFDPQKPNTAVFNQEITYGRTQKGNAFYLGQAYIPWIFSLSELLPAITAQNLKFSFWDQINGYYASGTNDPLTSVTFTTIVGTDSFLPAIYPNIDAIQEVGVIQIQTNNYATWGQGTPKNASTSTQTEDKTAKDQLIAKYKKFAESKEETAKTSWFGFLSK